MAHKRKAPDKELMKHTKTKLVREIECQRGLLKENAESRDRAEARAQKLGRSEYAKIMENSELRDQIKKMKKERAEMLVEV